MWVVMLMLPLTTMMVAVVRVKGIFWVLISRGLVVVATAV